MRLITILFIIAGIQGKAQVLAPETIKLTVPLGGNSFVTVKDKGAEKVTKEGWQNWQSEKVVFSTYIKVNKAGNLRVSAEINVPEGESRIRCSIQNSSNTITVRGAENNEYVLG